MQLFPPQPTHYLPLSILFLLRLADTSATHLSLLALQLLLRPNTTQNYCNAAVSLLLTPLIFLLNLDQISSIIYSYHHSHIATAPAIFGKPKQPCFWTGNSGSCCHKESTWFCGCHTASKNTNNTANKCFPPSDPSPYKYNIKQLDAQSRSHDDGQNEVVPQKSQRNHPRSGGKNKNQQHRRVSPRNGQD